MQNLTKNKKIILGISFAVIFTVTMTFTQASQMVYGNPICNGKAVEIFGSPGDDVLFGTPGDDVIASFGGNDIIHGAGGNDTICAGAGNDVLHGSFGNDWLDGGDGIDTIQGGHGKDTLLCSNGDGATGDGDHDIAKGGWGLDTFDVSCDETGAEDDDVRQGKMGDHPRFPSA